MKNKKVLIAISLSFIAVSLVACGSLERDQQIEDDLQNNISTEKEVGKEAKETEDRIYNLGDKIETEMFSILPKFTGYAERLANWPDENYMTTVGNDVNFSNTPYHASSDDKVMLYGEADIEYIGNEKTDVTLMMDFSVNYDDGYVFGEPHTGYATDVNGEWDYDSFMTFEPLSSSNARILRYCIEVPKQVEENPEKSLIMTVAVNGENYLYNLRSADVLGSDYDSRDEYYTSENTEQIEKTITHLKNNGLERWGYYISNTNSLGIFNFTFSDDIVTAKFVTIDGGTADFIGTYKVYDKRILITWDYGDEMHLDYSVDGDNIEIGDLDWGR